MPAANPQETAAASSARVLKIRKTIIATMQEQYKAAKAAYNEIDAMQMRMRKTLLDEDIENKDLNEAFETAYRASIDAFHTQNDLKNYIDHELERLRIEALDRARLKKKADN